MVDLSGIQRTAQRPVHDVVAFGLVLAAHVLQDTDVAALDDGLIGDIGAVNDLCEVGAWIWSDPRVCPIGGAGEENGCALCASWYEDERVELDAVTHRNHGDAFDVVE